jgi:hypothetical protein
MIPLIWMASIELEPGRSWDVLKNYRATSHTAYEPVELWHTLENHLLFALVICWSGTCDLQHRG